MGEQSVSLEGMRLILGKPDIETLMTSPLEDSFQYLRYLIDPKKAENIRLKFTVSVNGASKPQLIEVRNGVIITTAVSHQAVEHIDVTRKAWSEFIAGQRSFAEFNKSVALFESLLEK